MGWSSFSYRGFTCSYFKVSVTLKASQPLMMDKTQHTPGPWESPSVLRLTHWIPHALPNHTFFLASPLPGPASPRLVSPRLASPLLFPFHSPSSRLLLARSLQEDKLWGRGNRKNFRIQIVCDLSEHLVVCMNVNGCLSSHLYSETKS